MTLLKLLPRFRAAYHAQDELASRERWTRAEIESFQLDRLNGVWADAIRHVPHYRALQGRLDLPERFASLAEYQALVPVLPKADVRARPQDFLSAAARRGGWRRTGGSTGTPMRAYWADDAHRELLRTRYRFYGQWGVDIFDRMAFLWGHSASFAPGLSGRVARVRQPVEDRLRNRLRLSAYQLGAADLRDDLRRLGAFRPAAVYGYSTALHLLALEAEATGFVCDALKLFILTGEPATAPIVQTIERVFGAPAAIEYGAIECGVMASEWTDRTLRVREDVVLVETLPRADGGYDIVPTILSNPSFPLLRYQVEDVTDAPIERPALGFSILKNVSGRNNEFIRTRTGRQLHSARFDALFKYHSTAIRRFRVRQRADGALDVTLELEDPTASFRTPALEHELRELVEGYAVQVQVVDAIPQTAAGKHRLVMSDLATPLERAHVGNGGRRHGASGTGATARQTAITVGPDRGAPDGGLPEAAAGASPATRRQPARGKDALLRELFQRPDLGFLMEAHNGLSAKIVEEAGFEAIWASGLSISAALGVRDSNEASWTQVLEVLEFMNDAIRIPILVDGDTGHGNFNNMRRLVNKLEQRGIAGVCIEDKLFPKTNSFLRGTAQPLADIEEFCGRIRAGKDSQRSDDFVVVARVEAFIAGWGLDEALARAEAYRLAGADAILMHSALRAPTEVLAFCEAWGNRLPVVLVPTKYYATPTDVFRKYGVSAIIWANHLMRSCITAMQRTAQEIYEDETLISVEDRVAPLAEVFRLQGAPELAEAEKRYLPKNAGHTRAVVLAAARGAELGELTADRPKCMVSVAGTPLLAHIARTYRAAGVKDIVVVRGYRKQAVDLPGLRFIDNDEADATGAAWSLYQAREALNDHCLISFGDVLFKKHIAQELMDCDAEYAIMVDTNWRESGHRERRADYVTGSRPFSRQAYTEPVHLVGMTAEPDGDATHGEWTGFLKLSDTGALAVRALLEQRAADGETLRTMTMAGLLNALVAAGKELRIIYTTGSWMDVDSVDDLLAGAAFA
ncbi:MAG: phosphoenolpyruvate mutase [Gemmatimonadota bacterium]